MCSVYNNTNIRLKARKMNTAARTSSTVRERERMGTLIWRERDGVESST